MAGDIDSVTIERLGLYRKWQLWYQMVTCPVTSRDRKRPRSCQIYMDGNVLKSVSTGQTPCSLNIILLKLEWTMRLISANSRSHLSTNAFCALYVTSVAISSNYQQTSILGKKWMRTGVISYQDYISIYSSCLCALCCHTELRFATDGISTLIGEFLSVCLGAVYFIIFLHFTFS